MDWTGHRHVQSAQRGSVKVGGVRNSNKHKQSELYRIPSELVHEIFSSIPMNT
jgi:hypothetical protein